MSEDRDRTGSEVRLELYEEILKWLRSKNMKGDRLRFLDRPFVVTFIGGLFIAVLTIIWQNSEKRREADLAYSRAFAAEQITLLKQFSTVYESSGGALNNRFSIVMWIAEETNKTQTDATRKNINQWKEDIRASEAKFLSAGALDGLLAQVQVMYRCDSAKKTAAELDQIWREFQNGFQSFNREWNDKQKLPRETIDRAELLRKELLRKMEGLKMKLIEGMAAELSISRRGSLSCPS